MGGLGLGVLGPFLGPFGESGPGALQEPEGPSLGPSGPMGGWDDAEVKALRDNLFSVTLFPYGCLDAQGQPRLILMCACMLCCV